MFIHLNTSNFVTIASAKSGSQFVLLSVAVLPFTTFEISLLMLPISHVGYSVKPVGIPQSLGVYH